MIIMTGGSDGGILSERHKDDRCSNDQFTSDQFAFDHDGARGVLKVEWTVFFLYFIAVKRNLAIFDRTIKEYMKN